MSFTLRDIAGYRSEIAPCRTFGFVKDIGYLQKQGYALGGRFDNFVLFGDEGPINDKLRFPDEPVRHKILDAIGDLYLLGRPLSGKITASMTGHSDNVELLKRVRDALLAYS
jgi:UDP-3-O-[3-hydroxymyristoyl] N-acetylglucosamine deacetylase